MILSRGFESRPSHTFYFTIYSRSKVENPPLQKKLTFFMGRPNTGVKYIATYRYLPLYSTGRLFSRLSNFSTYSNTCAALSLPPPLCPCAQPTLHNLYSNNGRFRSHVPVYRSTAATHQRHKKTTQHVTEILERTVILFDSFPHPCICAVSIFSYPCILHLFLRFVCS